MLLLQTRQVVASRVALVDRLNPQKQTTKKVLSYKCTSLEQGVFNISFILRHVILIHCSDSLVLVFWRVAVKLVRVLTRSHGLMNIKFAKLYQNTKYYCCIINFNLLLFILNQNRFCLWQPCLLLPLKNIEHVLFLTKIRQI